MKEFAVEVEDRHLIARLLGENVRANIRVDTPSRYCFAVRGGVAMRMFSIPDVALRRVVEGGIGAELFFIVFILRSQDLESVPLFPGIHPAYLVGHAQVGGDVEVF